MQSSSRNEYSKSQASQLLEPTKRKKETLFGVAEKILRAFEKVCTDIIFFSLLFHFGNNKEVNVLALIRLKVKVNSFSLFLVLSGRHRARTGGKTRHKRTRCREKEQSYVKVALSRYSGTLMELI
jgi:hypothetical protein